MVSEKKRCVRTDIRTDATPKVSMTSWSRDQKLDFYGIRGISNLWFKSYLTERKQRVKYKSNFSENLKITCGVPQGSILGPLLFLIYINDMNKAIKNSATFHFADDTYLKFSCSSGAVTSQKDE